MNKDETDMLDTIIRKIETLQRRLKDDTAKARLGNARIELVRIKLSHGSYR